MIFDQAAYTSNAFYGILYGNEALGRSSPQSQQSRRKTDRLADSGALGLRRLARRITSPSFRIPSASWPCGGNQSVSFRGNLSKAGWSWGYASALDSNGRTIWVADAHRHGGKRFVAHADEKLTGFVELEIRRSMLPEALLLSFVFQNSLKDLAPECFTVSFFIRV